MLAPVPKPLDMVVPASCRDHLKEMGPPNLDVTPGASPCHLGSTRLGGRMGREACDTLDYYFVLFVLI